MVRDMASLLSRVPDHAAWGAWPLAQVAGGR